MLKESIDNILNNEFKLSDLVLCLDADDNEACELFVAADETRKKYVGDEIHPRGLIEIGNYCRCDCLYCGIRVSRKEQERYRLTKDEIITLAQHAYEVGYKSVVLQGGEDLAFSREMITEIIQNIKKNDMAITLSLGERDFADYAEWIAAGADRYLLRIETTDEKLFSQLHPTGNLAARKECIYKLKSLGYQLGSGIMIGLPGQTYEMVARDILWLKDEAKAQMLGVGPFIPHPDTPLKNAKGGTLFEALKLIALLRIVFKTAHIPATTALGALDTHGRERGLQCGANVIMPNITPLQNRENYEIYPGKVYNTDSGDKSMKVIQDMAKSIGRSISASRGDVF